MTSLDPTSGPGRLGGDPNAMRRAATEFDEQADRIHRYGEVMHRDVYRMWWKGPDSDRFLSAWEENHRRGNQRIIEELRRLAACLRQEAAKQESASRA